MITRFQDIDIVPGIPGEWVNTTDSTPVDVGEYYGRRATPATGDQIYNSWYLHNNLSNDDEMMRMTVTANGLINTLENSDVNWQLKHNGTLYNLWDIGFTAGGVARAILNNAQLSGFQAIVYGTGASGATSTAPLIVDNGGVTGIGIMTPATANGNLWFGSPTSSTRGFISYNHANDQMTLGTAGVTQVTIDSTGNITAVGNVTIGSASTKYLDFNDTVAPPAGPIGTAPGTVAVASTSSEFRIGKFTRGGDSVTSLNVTYRDSAVAERSIVQFDANGIVGSVTPTNQQIFFEGFVIADAQPKVRLKGNVSTGNFGEIQFGPGGATAPDITLGRSSVTTRLDTYISGTLASTYLAGTYAFQAATSITTTAGALTLAPVSGSNLALAVTGGGNIALSFGTGTITGAATFTGVITFSATTSFMASSPFSMTNGQVVTVALTAQTVGAATLTVPNLAGVADTFAFLTLAQTFVGVKTFSATAVFTSGATGIRWDQLSSPTAALNITAPAGDETTYTIQSATQYGFTWTSSTITSGAVVRVGLTGTSAAATAASNGTLATFYTTATGFTGATQRLIEINASGANTNASVVIQGLDIAINNTGTTNTNVALNLYAAGGSTANYALQISAGNINIAAATTILTPSTLTINAFTLGGALTLNGQTLTGIAAGTPTFSGAVVLSGTPSFTNANAFTIVNAQTLTVATTAQTVGAATLTIPNFAGVADTFAFITLAQTLSNKTLASPAFSGTSSGTYTLGGTLTINAFTLAGTISGGGQQLNNIVIGTVTPLAGTFTSLTATGLTITSEIIQTAGTLTFQKAYTLAITTGALMIQGATNSNITLQSIRQLNDPAHILFQTTGASPTWTVTDRLRIGGGLAAVEAQWLNGTTQTSLTLTASSKFGPASGVVGLAVVSTAYTLGSAGTVAVPYADMGNAANDAARDVLAGNLNGAIAIDSVGVAGVFKFWARVGGAWKSVTIS